LIANRPHDELHQALAVELQMLGHDLVLPVEIGDGPRAMSEVSLLVRR